MVKIVFLKINTWMWIVSKTDFVSCGFVCKIHSFETSENWQDTTYVSKVTIDKQYFPKSLVQMKKSNRFLFFLTLCLKSYQAKDY